LGKSREGDRAASAAWEKYISNTRGIREIVRTHTRVMLGKW